MQAKCIAGALGYVRTSTNTQGRTPHRSPSCCNAGGVGVGGVGIGVGCVMTARVSSSRVSSIRSCIADGRLVKSLSSSTWMSVSSLWSSLSVLWSSSLSSPPPSLLSLSLSLSLSSSLSSLSSSSSSSSLLYLCGGRLRLCGRRCRVVSCRVVVYCRRRRLSSSSASSFVVVGWLVGWLGVGMVWVSGVGFVRLDACEGALTCVVCRKR